MNRLLIILVFLLPVKVMGQMFPLSDHYIVNALPINPAFAGAEDALSATVSYRNQWTGFRDAPENKIISIHAPTLHDRVGLGLVVERNSIGIFRETSVIANYAYRTEFNSGKLALGMGFGFTSFRNAWNDLEAIDDDDGKLTDNPATAFLPDFSLGAYYYTKTYFFGVSMPLFLSHQLNRSSGKYTISNKSSGYNYFITGGYKFGLSPEIQFLPSVLVRYHPRHIFQADYSALFTFRQKISMGCGFRNGDMLIGMLQGQINDQLRLGYSYDFNLGRIGNYVNGSHELMLNYIFRYERNVMGPRQF